MKFWDSSALVPLVVAESTTEWIAKTHRSDPDVAVWYFTSTEVWTAVARKRHELHLGSPDVRRARDFLQKLKKGWTEIDDFDAVRSRAERLVEVHRLRSADALQLAAALVLVRDRPDRFPFVTLDANLGECADKEGFEVFGIDAP